MSKRYEKVVTLAVVNWDGVWGNKTANLAKMQAKVREATNLGANIICFPELALSGYECGEETKRTQRPCAMHIATAETIPGSSTAEMAKLAKKLDVYVIFGMPEKESKDSKTHYISAAIVGPEGVLGSYRKIHLAPPSKGTEYYCFARGSKLPLFETRFGPIGIQICADFWAYPELSRLLALKGARIIFNPTASSSSPGKVDMMTAHTAACGHFTQAFVVSCNRVGKERTVSYYGYSTIAGPGLPRSMKIFAQGGDVEEIVMATVNLEPIDRFRKDLRIKEAGNWKLIAREYRQIAESIQ